MRRPRRITFTVAALLVGAVLSLVTAEILVRGRGHGTWQPLELYRGQPIIVEKDSELGWRNKPGEYLAPTYDGSGRTTRIRILPDHSRATSPELKMSGRLIVLVGGSFTFGHALADHDTLAWQLQEEFPEQRFKNLGSSGYGTYQSLLWMERLFASDDPPKLVLYGLLWHHDSRNVAPPEWIRGLALFSRQGFTYLPYATVDESGNLVRHSPLGFHPWPLRRWLASAGYVQDKIAYWQHNERCSQRKVVTNQLLAAMDDLSRRNHAEFVVVVFDGMTDEHGYVRFMREKGIRYIDCDFPLWDSLRVPGEYHPNGDFNGLWVCCISEELGNEIAAAR